NNDQTQLPGTNINEGWLKAMAAVEANYGGKFGLRVSRRRYRLVQAGHVYSRQFRGIASESELVELPASLPPTERLLFGPGNSIAQRLAALLPQRVWSAIARRAIGQSPSWNPERAEGRYSDILEVFEDYAPAVVAD